MRGRRDMASEGITDQATPGGHRPPASLLARNPLRWIAVFGPGAIMASLTIGTGELIFSSRGGALFGYRVLFLFAGISLLKWALVYSMARHMVLTGTHPFARWAELPGPRGWLPATFLVLGFVSFPVWVGFHSVVLGNFLATRTGTAEALQGGAQYAWGAAILGLVSIIAFRGGYAALERAQLVIVGLLLLSVTIALVLLRPDWWSWLTGFVVPGPLRYADWVATRAPEIAARPVWSEATLYVGVIGGASYDYLAYVSFLREKRWGLAVPIEAPPVDVAPVDTGRIDGLNPDAREAAEPPSSNARAWLRAPLVDTAASFAVVLVFSGVFVACGHLVLGPRQAVPDADDFLGKQAAFVAEVHPTLVWVYLLGAFLAMLGTLYGTIEVAPAVLREFAGAAGWTRSAERLRRDALCWSVAVAALIIVSQLSARLLGRVPPSPIALLAPVNLFTGVLSCGAACWLTAWTDWRFLPAAWRPPIVIRILQWIAGATLLALGVRGYLEFGAEKIGGGAGALIALGTLVATLALGWILASTLRFAKETRS